MNNIETGISNAVTTNGDTGISVTLSGSDKKLLSLKATDGKEYQLIQRNSDKAIILKNITDGVLLFEFGPTAGKLTTNGNKVWHAGNDGSGSGLDADLYQGRHIYVQTTTPSSPSEGDVWIKG